MTTAIQTWTRALFELLLDARDDTGDEDYQWFVAIATERIGLEAARLAVGEALRAKRDNTDRRVA